jgi:hypothetical protein
MKTQFITDVIGRKKSVVIPIRDYKKILDELEELADLRAYDEAKASHEESIPFDTAIKEIEAKRYGIHP